MIKLLTIIGARPQIIKAAALSREIKKQYHDSLEEVIAHTGQHYDMNMSEVFINEMEIPSPDYNLDVRSGSHGTQTAKMIIGIEDIINKESPDYLIIYGDTNSTIAGALAASKLNVPVVHIEAGLRSFNRNMPEEINRVLSDHASTLLFSPTDTGLQNLAKEGFTVDTENGPFYPEKPGVFNSGDVMYDNTLFFKEIAEKKHDVLSKFEIKQNQFVLVTVHRNYNTDNPKRLKGILESLLEIASQGYQIVFPIHPRTRKILQEGELSGIFKSLESHQAIGIIQPVSFLEMTLLEKHASIILTDSGGVQKEAYFFNKPCVILRSETEWVEVLDTGYAEIADADKNRIIESFERLAKLGEKSFPVIFGDGKAASFICQKIIQNGKINQ